MTAREDASTYPVSITTSPGAVRLHCSRCRTTALLLLLEQEIDRHVPVFLGKHPERCVPSVTAQA